ncbi:MAG TPA: OmcA/MtrC family decaheme c-type cytochrome [Bryobacteraceae bacterium]|nr:OmcA/MtrC family decaheme c-type cytochrome [Bryobacteraceae bacterium]
MRIFSSGFAVRRWAVALALVGGSVVLMSGARKTPFTTHDKAYFAPQAIVEYVNPGLVFSVVSAKIASDGTISVDYKVTDPQGLPLDIAGIQTPGVISPRYIAAYIPKGQTQFSSYVVNTVTAISGGATATQAAGDSGGTTTTVAVGEYVYTFKTKAPSNFDPTVTNRIGIYGSRNLTQWDLGTDYASTTFDFVPNGSKVTLTRDVVRTPDCNKCHDQLAFHGGSRRGVDLCIMCHQPQTSDPNTGNSLDFKVFIHSIHMGSSLPSVAAGKPYQVVGFGNAATDWSSVVYPADVRRCQTCHNPQNGAAQTNNWLMAPSRAACGGCHNDVNFATGLNHVNLPQVDDSQCTNCHIPQGELEFDASIKGAHTIPDQSATIPGLNFTLVKVINGGAGQKPTVTFTVKDNQGNGVPMSTFTSNSGSLSLTMAGPTSDFGYTDFGVSTTPGYVTESALGASCSSDGTCQYTFTHAVPAKATGTYAIGIEGRISITLLPGTTQQMTTQYAGVNQVIYFSTDGTPVQPRRTVVALANCNNCHAKLEIHGNLRNNTAYCVICHNPSNTDFTQRPSSVVAADRSLPNQAINFALMIHKIHTGTNLATQFNQNYVIVGFGGSHNDFGTAFASVPSSIQNTGVRFPAMSPTGAVHDTTNCSLCHSGGSEAVFPIGKNPVTDPQGLLNPAPTTTSACTACHLNTSAMAHAQAQTDPKFGESCDVCHGSGAAYDVDQVHAGK